MEPKVVLCIVHSGQICADTFFSIYYLDKPKSFELAQVKGTQVANQRNTAIKGFLDTDFTHLFFVDSDMILPKNALEKLLSANTDIITGLYFMKKEPYFPVIGRKNVEERSWIINYPQDKIIEIDFCGMGCTLIKRDALQKILPKTDSVGGINQFFSYSKNFTEDVYFCEKAKEAGLKIFCDTSVKCDHITESKITEKHFLLIKDKIRTS